MFSITMAAQQLQQLKAILNIHRTPGTSFPTNITIIFVLNGSAVQQTHENTKTIPTSILGQNTYVNVYYVNIIIIK